MNPPTPAWKISVYVAIPLLLALLAAFWITGGDKLTGDSECTNEHSLEKK